MSTHDDDSNTTVTTCSTKPDAGGSAVTTELTLDWNGVGTDRLIEFATRSVVIAWQASARKRPAVPAAETVRVADIGVRKRAAPAAPVTVGSIVADVSAGKLDMATLMAELERVAAAMRAAGAATDSQSKA